MKMSSLGAREEAFVSMREYNSGEDNRDRRTRMKRFIATAIETELTEKQKYCITEHFFKNKYMYEIAADLGVNVSTVSFHIKQGLKKIKKRSVYVKFSGI